MNSMFSKILSYGIIGVVVVLTVIGMIIGTRSEDFDMLFYVVYGLGIMAIAGVVFGFVLNAITNPKSLVIPVASIVGLLVLFFISYSTAGNETYAKPLPVIGAGLSQFIGGILTLTYVLMLLAFLSIFAAWVIRIVR